MAEEHKKLKHHKTNGYHTTTMRHHEDGSHTIRHEHEDGISHKEYAASDHDGAMDGLMQHTSQPDEEEAAADGGNHGVEAAEAAKAGIPMPAQGA